MIAYIGTAVVGIISTSVLFFFPNTIAAMFASNGDTTLLTMSAWAIKLFCFAYLFRWVGVTTQGFLSAINKPMLATIVSVSTAFVFPTVMLGALWTLKLDGIWLNFVGVNILTAILSVILLIIIIKKINKKEAEKTAST